MADDVPDALERLDELRARLAGRRLALFLDYDGTLSELVPRPEDATLSPARRELVRRLARRAAVAVVSGRDLADVKARVDAPELAYAGSHGFDVEGPPGSGVRERMAEEYARDLDAAQAALERRLAGVDGAQVERKRFSIATHTRRVPESKKPAVRAAVEEVLGEQPRLRSKRGHEVTELLPDLDWDKGKAVLRLLDALGLDAPDVLAVYVGDDVTDEDAFRALAGRGVGVLVSEAPRATAATYRLRDPAAVEQFLEGLLAGLLEQP